MYTDIEWTDRMLLVHSGIELNEKSFLDYADMAWFINLYDPREQEFACAVVNEFRNQPGTMAARIADPERRVQLFLLACSRGGLKAICHADQSLEPFVLAPKGGVVAIAALCNAVAEIDPADGDLQLGVGFVFASTTGFQYRPGIVIDPMTGGPAEPEQDDDDQA